MQSISQQVCCSREVFFIAVCAAAVLLPFNEFITSSAQLKFQITLPKLNANLVFTDEELEHPLKRILINQMGGHGRAIEACQQVFHHIPDGTWQKYTKALVQKLQNLYGSRLHALADTHWRHVLRAIFARKRFVEKASSRVWINGWTVEDVISAGLFSFDENSLTLEVAPIFLQLINDAEIERWRISYSELGFFVSPQEYLTTSALWQNWEILNAHFRCLKALVFSGETISFEELHSGAIFPRKMSHFKRKILIKPLTYAKLVHRQNTDSNSCGLSDFRNMYHSAEGSQSGDAFICFRSKKYHFHEVHQYKHKKLSLSLAHLNSERSKACSVNDIFICFTTGTCDIPHDSLPENCAVVCKNNWMSYYGPFWASLFYLKERIVNINSATEYDLCAVNRIGKKRAREIILERTERGNFRSAAEATQKELSLVDLSAS
jgi:hypothetical protein